MDGRIADIGLGQFRVGDFGAATSEGIQVAAGGILRENAIFYGEDCATTNMGHGQFNSVAILDAIPEGEFNTARRLREDLDDLRLHAAEGLQIRYFHIRTILDLESAISALEGEARINGLIPWVHLEGHGAADETGFGTADQTYCPWSRLVELVTPLNVATNINVVIVLATCFGGTFTKAITAIDRAPVLGLIGPTREVTVGEVEIDFPSFYKSFFTTGSLKEAVSALTSRAPTDLYYRTTAEDFFYAVWTNYKRTQCSDKQIGVRARKIRKKLKAQDAPIIPTVGKLKRQIRSEEKGKFEEYRDKYFMYDLYPENRTRFPVTYKQAEKNAFR